MTHSTPPLQDLPLWAWLGLPPLLVLAQLLTLGWSKEIHDAVFTGELGVVELGTTLVYLPGIVAGLLALRLRDRLPKGRLAAVWIAIFVLGSFYIAGEEISWGQHLFQWQSPELFQAINKQQETNLHNTSSWLNQKPRLAMELWILVGGIIVPLRQWLGRRRPDPRLHWQAWVWPTPVILPAALMCFFIKLPVHVQKWLELEQPLFTGFNLNETHEFSIALFLTLYLCSIYFRARQMPCPA